MSHWPTVIELNGERLDEFESQRRSSYLAFCSPPNRKTHYMFDTIILKICRKYRYSVSSRSG